MMPSIRIYDGDLLSLMAAFDKLNERMSAAEAVLTTILQAVDTTKDLLLTPSVVDAFLLTHSVCLLRAT